MRSEASAQSPLTDYQKLRDEAEQLRKELDAIGRTDVPYDDQRHIRFAAEPAQQVWWATHRRLWDVEAQRELAWQACLEYVRHGEH
jgi:hypothetical protein